MGSKRTKSQLRDVTDYIGFESFCHDLMALCGYKDILPLGGFKDKGRDAIHVSRTGDCTTIFAYSVREDWETKLAEDLDKIKQHDHHCDEVVFITTEEPTAGDLDRWQGKVLEEFGWKLDIYSLERIATLVDSLYEKLKGLHPNIFYLDAGVHRPDGMPAEAFHPLDSQSYASYMLNAFAEWQERYTPLLAEYREFELYAVDTSSTGGPVEMPVLEVPEVAPVAILLGESGAGKTTSLWKLAVDLSSRLIRDEPTRLPVMVSLRNWSQICVLRQLVQNQFSCVGAANEVVEEELVNGNCLILVDGLNELPHVYEQKDAARRDLQNFLDRYPGNQYVFTCRTPDYDPEFLEIKPDRTPPSFEIRRLDRDQIEDYVRRNFRDEPSSADDLLTKLNLRSDLHWGRKSSFVHLARIPLYLQMVIWEYRQTGHIPPNKSKMLHAFIAQVVRRDAVRQAARISLDGKTRILGYLAYESIKAGHYLSLPESLAKMLITGAFRGLRSEGAVPPDIPVDDVWQEILSNNFLHVRRGVSQQGVGESLLKVEWLHQLIFDFFLGHETIRILVDSETEAASKMRSSMVKFESIWDQPCQIALGLLDLHRGAKLAEILFRTNTSLAQRAVKGQSEEDAANLAGATVQRVTQVDAWDAELLARIALALPYVTVVNRLRFVFKWSRESERESIAMIMSQIVISHYGSEGAERAQDILEAWISNRNELVKHYAAMGLWERDRGRAAGALRELYAHGSPETQRLVRQLSSRWGFS